MYNCAYWTQKTASIPASSLLNCDGLSQNGEWTTTNGSREEITSAANYSGGAGGSGQRHWIGDTMGGSGGSGSGGLLVQFTSQPEVWIR